MIMALSQRKADALSDRAIELEEAT